MVQKNSILKNIILIVASLSFLLVACIETPPKVEPTLQMYENQNSGTPYSPTSSSTLHINDFENHPGGTLTEVPSSYELAHPDWDYTLVKLFITDDGAKTWELYGFADEEDLSTYRLNNCDRDYSSGTDPDTGQSWTKCSGDGDECRAFTDDEGGVIIMKCD